MFWTVAAYGQATIVWKEGFEDDFWERWSVEGGVWAVGNPTSGPNKAFAGNAAAGTVLDGNYPPAADARFVRDLSFVVPAATDHPRLRFWHWYRGAAGDSRSVEVKVGFGPWQPVTAASGWNSDDWARALIDLSPFSGQRIQISFHFQSNADAEVAAGWYVDEVALETGPMGADLINTVETFEAGLGNWTIDHGVWAVGKPTFGPPGSFSGVNCVGTVLDGNYRPSADSRLISPEFLVPAGTDNPRLRFWHWYGIWPGDPARVEISVGGGAWQPLSTVYANNSLVWTRASFDLRAFAGQNVQIAFHFQANADADVAAGWYVDDVVVETGPLAWNPVETFADFEGGLGNWSAENGVWEVGIPKFGPDAAHGGLQCAGTVLAGAYADSVDSRLVSPEFTVPAVTDRPRLRFWQWLRNLAGDPATVEIRTVGGDWKALSAPTVASDGSWARPLFALDNYAGQRVQLAFRFQSNADAKVGAGWYIDDVGIEVGPPRRSFLNTPEDFENGLGDWAVDNGTWQVGTPREWPETAHSGANCVGPVGAGKYAQGVDSRLISPEFIVPAANESPRLRFWHWFSSWPSDPGTVEISVNGGSWQALSRPYSGSGVVWTRPSLDLKAFAGQSVRIAFHFQSDTDGNVGPGWYVDDAVVETGPVELDTFNKAEGFESGLGNWSVDNGTWEVGVPRSGPGLAFKGTNCAATVLAFSFGNYGPGADTRLISPEFVVPCAEAGPRLRFAQWYDMAAGDFGSVEVRVVGAAWQQVIGPIVGSSRDWTTSACDLSAFAGQRVQIAFRFQSNDDALISSGWYLDEVKIQATVLQAIDRTTVPEGSLFTYTFGSPCQNLRYRLGPGVPDGATIDPVLGILVWLPSEDQGPGVYPIQVCASDLDHPDSAVECVTMEVTVLEINTAPVLDPIDSKTIIANVPVTFTATAFDTDRPRQKLTFSLEGAPFGATIDPATGAFSWTPTPTQATMQSTITIRVTDDGNPALSAMASFTAGPVGPVSALHVEVTWQSPELLNVCVKGGTAGVVYVIESASELKSPPNLTEWTDPWTFWKETADQSYCKVVPSNSSSRFYRVRSLQ